MVKEISIKSNNQSGGITAHRVNINHDPQKNKGLWANPTFKNIVIPILIGVLILGLSIGANKMFGKDKAPSEVYNVESNNQSGGITAGKIDNVNILTDKESLGIREPNGLYQNGKKVGNVINFRADESANTFTISKIKFDNPIRDQNSVWRPYEYQNYVIQIKNIRDLVLLMPPGAEQISGIILSKS